jgi:hypothetical protein
VTQRRHALHRAAMAEGSDGEAAADPAEEAAAQGGAAAGGEGGAEEDALEKKAFAVAAAVAKVLTQAGDRAPVQVGPGV